MFWGTVITVAGIGWFLQNLGYLSGSFWDIFWPLVIIAIGLSLLAGKRNSVCCTRIWPIDKDKK